jgi:hypothetical protein
MTPLRYKFLANARVVSMTLGFIALLIVIIQGYVDDDFDALRVIVMVLIALNIVYIYIAKPRNPDEIQHNGDSQEA